MRIVMIHTAFNELRLLPYKLEYCKRNNLELYIIDNMSDDGSAEWMKANNVQHSFIDTNGSFDLRPLLDEMTKKIHELKPDWFIYSGIDMFFEATGGVYSAIERADREGYTQIQSLLYTIRNIGEGQKEGNPFVNHVYANKGYHFNGTAYKPKLISKYDKSVKIIPDNILRDNIIIKNDGVYFEMHGTKTPDERMQTLRRREKAWSEGLNPAYGEHYRRGAKVNFTYKISDCIDIRQTPEYHLYKRLQEL